MNNITDETMTEDEDFNCCSCCWEPFIKYECIQCNKRYCYDCTFSICNEEIKLIDSILTSKKCVYCFKDSILYDDYNKFKRDALYIDIESANRVDRDNEELKERITDTVSSSLPNTTNLMNFQQTKKRKLEDTDDLMLF